MALKSKDLDKVRQDVPVGSTRQIKQLGKKSIITVSIDPVVLARVDKWAKDRGMSRAAAISFAVSKLEE